MNASLLAEALTLSGALDEIRTRAAGCTVLDHWQQGEFHHDTVLRVDSPSAAFPDRIVVIATNCNGGVKEVLYFGEPPDRSALWHWRCPESDEFCGELPAILDYAKTVHWFDPCVLLADDARSELLPEARERQPGGGWRMKSCGAARKP